MNQPIKDPHAKRVLRYFRRNDQIAENRWNCRVFEALRNLFHRQLERQSMDSLEFILKNTYPHCSRTMRVCEFYSPLVNLSSQ